MSTDLHTLSGAFAIDALSPDEAAAFRTHLEGCPACRDEVRELRDAAAMMGEIEAQTPPAALRAKVLAAANRTPQLPPLVTSVTDRRARTTGPRRFAPRLLVAAAVVALLAGLGVGITQLNGDEGPTLAASVSQVFDAPDAHKATVSTSNGGRLVVATSPSLGRMAVETDGLPMLGDRQVYQLWTITNGVATSAGVLEDLGGGAAMSMPGRRTQVAITIEPTGGSAQPTTAPIATVDPASV